MTEDSKSSGECLARTQPAVSASIPLPPVVPAAVVLIAVLTFVAYLPCLNGGFIWDDNDLYITRNPIIPASDGLHRFWSTSEPYDFYPLSNTSLWIEWRLWGMNPAGYHVSNLIFHIVEALLIWIVLRKLSIQGAFLAGLIFALHPVNVEPVAWISQRKDMMAVLFFLVSILWYLKAGMAKGSSDTAPPRSDGGPWERVVPSSLIPHPISPVPDPSSAYWLSLTAFVLAMLCKGAVAVLPVILLGIAWYLRPLTLRAFLRTAPFFAIAAALTIVNVWFQRHGSGEVFRNADFLERLLGAGSVVWFYLGKAVFPLNLAFMYPQFQIKADDWLCWLPLAAAVAITVVLWLYRKTWSRTLLFAWGFFCVALAPVLGFTDVYFMRYSLVSDHYQHIALMGVAALAAACFVAWRRRAPAEARLAMLALAIVAVGALALLTFRQSGLYKDEITLYTDTLRKNPDSWLLHNNLSLDLVGLNMPQQAIEHLERALQIKPDYAMAQNNLGNALARTGRLREAIEHFEQALRLQPKYPEAEGNLGSALLNADRMQEAIDHFQKALQFDPDYPVARYDLGNALLKMNRLQEAIEQYERAVRVNPDYPEAQSNLGSALIMASRGQEAIPHCKEALRLRPHYVDARFNLALAYAQISQPYDAIAEAAQSLQDANAQGRIQQAATIENWLDSYRAGLRDAPDRAGSKK